MDNSTKNNLNRIKNNIQFLEKLKKENRIKDCKIQKKTAYALRTGCIHPFTAADISYDGEVYTCCSDFIRHNSIGNIYKNSLEEIWNSEKAQELRNKISNNDYSMCDLSLCSMRIDTDLSLLPEKPRIKRLVLSYNRECNLYCITCRDKKHVNTLEQNKLYNERMYEYIKPFLNDVQIIETAGSGEVFFSKHSRELIKKIAAEHPHIRWKIFSNGVFFNTANSKALGIYGKIAEVLISLPAIDKNIYNKIMRGSDYDTVMKNIKEAAYECSHNKAIKIVSLSCVISSLNYKEIPKLAQFAQKYNLHAIIVKYRHWGTEFGKDYKSVSVWDKEHSEYENFKKILKHPSLNYRRISMTPLFKKIRETK